MIKHCKRCGKAYNILSPGSNSMYGPECAKLVPKEELDLLNLLDDNKVEYNDPFLGVKVRIDKDLGYDLSQKNSIRKWLGLGGETQQGLTLLKFMVDAFVDPKNDNVPESIKTILTNMLNNQLREDHKRWIINSLLAEIWQYMSEAGKEGLYNNESLINRIMYRTKEEWISISKRKDWQDVISKRNQENFNLFIDKLKRGDF